MALVNRFDSIRQEVTDSHRLVLLEHYNRPEGFEPSTDRNTRDDIMDMLYTIRLLRDQLGELKEVQSYHAEQSYRHHSLS